MSNSIKISVCVITYNHEKYIRDCLDSIFTQEIDFPFEVIVADDYSTDDTRNIISEYSLKYPDQLKVILHPSNVGVYENYRSAHDLAQGQYVAHCDGDDFWYKGKLKFQIQKLDEDDSLVQCWTCAKIVNEVGQPINIFPSKLARRLYPRILSPQDIALSYSLVGQHSTQVYRRIYKPKISESQFLDYWVAFNLSLKGNSLYIPEIFGAYRITTTPSLTRHQKAKKVAVDLLSEHLGEISRSYPIYKPYVKANLATRILLSWLKKHDLAIAIKEYGKMRDVPLRLGLFIKSIYYFLLQKIR